MFIALLEKQIDRPTAISFHDSSKHWQASSWWWTSSHQFKLLTATADRRIREEQKNLITSKYQSSLTTLPIWKKLKEGWKEEGRKKGGINEEKEEKKEGIKEERENEVNEICKECGMEWMQAWSEYNDIFEWTATSCVTALPLTLPPSLMQVYRQLVSTVQPFNEQVLLFKRASSMHVVNQLQIDFEWFHVLQQVRLQFLMIQIFITPLFPQQSPSPSLPYLVQVNEVRLIDRTFEGSL